MIVASHLTRTFGDRLAVEDVTFEVGKGEVFGLLGPNGAGKTTTLRMLAGLIAPTSGEASVAGVPLTQTDDRPRARRRSGFLTEAPGLWDRLSVRMNLLTYARLHQLPDPHGGRRARARAVRAYGSRATAWAPSCRRDSSSAWPSPARCCTIRPSCCWTNPHPGWTRKARGWCAISCWICERAGTR